MYVIYILVEIPLLMHMNEFALSYCFFYSFVFVCALTTVSKDLWL